MASPVPDLLGRRPRGVSGQVKMLSMREVELREMGVLFCFFGGICKKTPIFGVTYGEFWCNITARSKVIHKTLMFAAASRGK